MAVSFTEKKIFIMKQKIARRGELSTAGLTTNFPSGLKTGDRELEIIFLSFHEFQIGARQQWQTAVAQWEA